MLLSAVRGVAGLGHVLPASVPLALLSLRAISTTEWHKGSNRFQNVWETVLHSAKSSPEKLHDIVDVLSKHCVSTQTAPPLDAFNELLRLCDAHGDVASVQKLTQMSMAVSMHLDEHTYMRLDKFFNYFPRPFPDSARTASSSSGSSSSSIHHHHSSHVTNTNIHSTAAPAAHDSSTSNDTPGMHVPNTCGSSDGMDNKIGFETDSCPSAHGQPNTTATTTTAGSGSSSVGPSSNIGSSAWPGASMRPWPRRPGGYNADISAKSPGPSGVSDMSQVPAAPTSSGRQAASHTHSSSSGGGGNASIQFEVLGRFGPHAGHGGGMRD